MSSAAKLRKFGRGTATIATAALVMTSFGPTAFAWSGSPGDATAGVVDTVAGTVPGDDTTSPSLTDPGDDNQGAEDAVLTAGATGQNVASIRLAVPNNYSAGDTIDLELDDNTTGARSASTYVSWSGTPQVSVSDLKAGTTTVNADTDAIADNTETTTTALAAADAAGATKPQPTAALVVGPNAYSASKNILRLTLPAAATGNTAAKGGKWVITVSGLKADLGGSVASGPVYARVSSSVTNLFAANAAVPVGYVTPVKMAVANGGITADGNPQGLGTATITEAAAASLPNGVPVKVNIEGVSVLGGTAKVNVYNEATGALITTSPIDATVTATSGSTPGFVTIPGATFSDTVRERIEISGVMGQTTTPGRITWAIDGIGAPGAVFQNSDVTTSGGKTAVAFNQGDVLLPSFGAVASGAALLPSQRIGGTDRYETAAKLAEEANGSSATVIGESDTVVLASGEGFADALSSGFLAATQKAQLLLTRQGSLPKVTSEFLRNHGTKKVYIIGGTGSVSRAIEDQLKDTQAFDVTTDPNQGNKQIVAPLATKLEVIRIAGADRFDTNRAVNEYAAAAPGAKIAALVSKYGQASKRTALVANGLAPWDALSAGPLVGGTRQNKVDNAFVPIVLTTGSGLIDKAARQMDTLDIGHAIMIGGYGAVAQKTAEELTARAVTSSRLGGADRWETAAAIGDFAMRSDIGNATTNTEPGLAFKFNATPNSGFSANMTALLTNGGQPNNTTGWADALASGPYAASARKLVGITPQSFFIAETKALFQKYKSDIDAITAVGLGGSISTETLRDANATVAG